MEREILRLVLVQRGAGTDANEDQERLWEQASDKMWDLANQYAAELKARGETLHRPSAKRCNELRNRIVDAAVRVEEVCGEEFDEYGEDGPRTQEEIAVLADLVAEYRAGFVGKIWSAPKIGRPRVECEAEIWADVQAGEMTAQEIARKYKVSRVTVYRIIWRKREQERPDERAGEG